MWFLCSVALPLISTWIVIWDMPAQNVTKLPPLFGRGFCSVTTKTGGVRILNVKVTNDFWLYTSGVKKNLHAKRELNPAGVVANENSCHPVLRSEWLGRQCTYCILRLLNSQLFLFYVNTTLSVLLILPFFFQVSVVVIFKQCVDTYWS